VIYPIIRSSSNRGAPAHATISAGEADPKTVGVPIDPDTEEVQQLKSATMPLLFQLSEGSKARALARLVGLEKVAAQI
jgi:hypothetical protein